MGVCGTCKTCGGNTEDYACHNCQADEIEDLQHRNDWLWEERTKTMTKLGATPEEASDPDEYLPNWVSPKMSEEAEAAKELKGITPPQRGAPDAG